MSVRQILYKDDGVLEFHLLAKYYSKGQIILSEASGYFANSLNPILLLSPVIIVLIMLLDLESYLSSVDSCFI